MPLASLRIGLLLLLLTIVSCNSQKKALTGAEHEQNNSDSLVLLVQDTYAPVDSAETLVIRDENSLRKFFSRINMTRKPGIPVPEVDFSKEMILIFCAGTYKNEAFPSLSIVEETEKEVVVSAAEKKPDESTTSIPLVSPFSVYKMPVTSKEVVFKLPHR